MGKLNELMKWIFTGMQINAYINSTAKVHTHDAQHTTG